VIATYVWRPLYISTTALFIARAGDDQLVEKLIEAAGGALIQDMILPAVARRELRKVEAGVEKVGVDAGVFRPVRGTCPAVGVDAPAVLQPGDEAARPALASRADPGRLDRGKVVDVEAVPRGVEAAQQLDEMVEIGAVLDAAPQGAARGEEDGCR
jgi:hypothetical protein